jgi:glycerol-3-phosphate dehydrogenase (NAD(P)+)
MSAQASIAVLGAGSWGTALGIVLARNGHNVCLWARDPGLAERSQQDRVNARYLPDCPFPESLQITADLPLTLNAAEQVWLALPTKVLADFLRDNAAHFPVDAIVVNASKGFEQGTGRQISQMVASCLPKHPFVAVSGPTFAHEVATAKPSAITVASVQPQAAECIAATLRNPTLRTYPTDDVIGVEIAGGLKNVLAIAAGVADGFGFGANARAALITRGLAELMRLGGLAGAKPETFMGLAGVGDLVLTCTDDQSRNRRFGLKLAQGYTRDEAVAAIGQAVEGIGAAAEGERLAGRYQVDMPIVHAVYQVLYEGVLAREAVSQILAREPRHQEI